MALKLDEFFRDRWRALRTLSPELEGASSSV